MNGAARGSETPAVFAWTPRDVDLPPELAIVPSVLVRFAESTGSTIYPWYHDLPIWQLQRDWREEGGAASSLGIQVGFAGLADWPLPGSEGEDSIRVTMSAWIAPRKKPGAVATVILRGPGISSKSVAGSLTYLWQVIGAQLPPERSRALVILPPDCELNPAAASDIERIVRDHLSDLKSRHLITGARVGYSVDRMSIWVVLSPTLSSEAREAASHAAYECATRLSQAHPSVVVYFHVVDPDACTSERLSSMLPPDSITLTN